MREIHPCPNCGDPVMLNDQLKFLTYVLKCPRCGHKEEFDSEYMGGTRAIIEVAKEVAKEIAKKQLGG